MTTGLLFDCDEHVARFIFQIANLHPMKWDRAIGIVSGDGKMLGGVLFQNWNGPNVDLSYYGKRTLTPGIIRCLARFVIASLGVARLTVITSKRNKRLIRALQNLGFKLEGAQRCYYGHRDCNRNTGVRFVMFRERINELARLETEQRGEPNVAVTTP